LPDAALLEQTSCPFCLNAQVFLLLELEEYVLTEDLLLE
jgi:hypothetical protein